MGRKYYVGAEPGAISSTITDLVEKAFRYRGDVTVDLAKGEPVTVYLFNRNSNCITPFVQLFEARTRGEVTVLYQDITHIRFTGRDAAAATARQFEISQRQ